MVINGTVCGQNPWEKSVKVPCPKFNASNPGPSPVPVLEADIADAVAKIVSPVKIEMVTFNFGMLVAPDLLPGENDAGRHLLRPGSVRKVVACGIYICRISCVAIEIVFGDDNFKYSGSNGAYGHIEKCEEPL